MTWRRLWSLHCTSPGRSRPKHYQRISTWDWPHHEARSMRRNGHSGCAVEWAFAILRRRPSASIGGQKPLMFGIRTRRERTPRWRFSWRSSLHMRLIFAPRWSRSLAVLLLVSMELFLEAWAWLSCYATRAEGILVVTCDVLFLCAMYYSRSCNS